LFDLGCLAVLMVVLARAYNRLTAIIAVVMLGLSLQGLGVTSSVYPEWMQADLLILALCLAYFAWMADGFVRKAFWYALSFAMFTWSYFTKFNVLVFLPVLFLFIALEKGPWTRRAKLLAAALAFAFLNYAFFVFSYHRPRTGTVDLSYDHAWVLLTKLDMTYRDLPYPQGIATKRWLALSSVLPPTYNVAGIGMFENVNSAPKEIRVAYRRAAGYLLTADERTLDDVLRRHSLPKGFSLGVSPIPIAWYIGLKESDQLGIKVFRESIFHRFAQYLRATKDQVHGAVLVPNYMPLFPTSDNVGVYSAKLVPLDENLLRIDLRPGDHSLPYSYSDPFIWRPGYEFFSWMMSIETPQRRIVILLLVGFIGALILAVIDRRRFPAVASAVLTAQLAGYVVVSCAVLDYRWKEARLALPVIAILVGIAAGWTIPQLFMTGLRRLRPTTTSPDAG
jgi:hypothetical protein